MQLSSSPTFVLELTIYASWSGYMRNSDFRALTQVNKLTLRLVLAWYPNTDTSKGNRIGRQLPDRQRIRCDGVYDTGLEKHMRREGGSQAVLRSRCSLVDTQL